MALTLKRDAFDYSAGYANPRTIPAGSVSFAGAVLSVFGRDERIMSDVWAWCSYAAVVDGDKVVEIGIGNSEFGASYDATVDATLDAVAIATRYFLRLARRAVGSESRARIQKAVENAKRIEKGKEVEVVRGRKVSKGTMGEVFWVGDNGWGLSVGIRKADGSAVFTAAKNVEVANPDDYFVMPELPTRASIERHAAALAADRFKAIHFNAAKEAA